MNDYGFDYMNYINNIPNNSKYNQMDKVSINYANANNKINMNYGSNKMKEKNFNNKLFSPTEGWIKGNLFSNLYEPYKKYKPANIEPKNERESLLYQIMQYKFILIELDLYLDTNPYDDDIIKIYNQYLDIEKQMCDKYENLYGPLTLDSNYLDSNSWNWLKSPWPWEVL